MAITPTSSDSSTELSGKVDSPAVFNGGDADSVSGEEVEEVVEVEEDGDEEEDPEEVLEEEEEEEVSEDGDEDDPEEVEEEDEDEVKGDGAEDSPEEVAEEEEEEEGGEDGEEEEEGGEDDEDPVEEEEVVEEEIEDVEEEEVEEVEMEIAEEEEEITEEDGEEPMEEDEEEAEVVEEEDSEEVEEDDEEEEGEEEIDADGEEVVEEEVEEAEEVKGGQEDVQAVLEEDNVKVEDDIGKKVDEDVVREEIKEGEVKEEEEEIKEMEGDGEDGGVVEEEVKQEDVAMKGEEDIKVEDVGEKVEEENRGEGPKEGTDLLIVNSRDITAKIEPGGPGGPNSFSCTPERCNPSTTVVHVKDGNGGNLTASYPSDETGSGAQMEVDMPTEPLKDVEQGPDSQIGLVSRDSVAGQYTRLDQENNTSLEKKNEHCDVLEIEASHLHTKTDLQTREGLGLPSMHTPEKRPRSSSPDAGIKHANKRPAIICDFFARGWCIKGKSCSFLHQKEGVSNTSLQTKDVAGINRNGGFLHGTGLREDDERAKRSASQELLSNTESSSKSPSTAQKDLVRTYGEVLELPKLHYDYSMHGAHPQSRRASYAPTDDFRQPFSRDEFKRPYGPSPHIDAMGERRLAGDNLLSGRYTASHFPSQDSRTSGSMTSSLRASTHGFTRMGVEHLDARMPSDFDRGNYGYRSASLTKSISSYCSPSEVLHTAQKDVLLTGKKAEVRDAWVPSIPFRSSFCRDPTNIPSYRSQYDPVLDSITPSNVARSTFETIQNVSNGGTTPSGIHTPGYGAQQSLNSFSQHPEAVFGKSKVDHGLNGSAGTSATPEPSTVDGGSSFMSKKDEHWIPGHAVDGVNVNGAEASLGGDLKNIEDKGRNNKDSRAMKFFHCALVDFVKELVKPSWREGHLSKDAHKTVVKKAVEKVLSAIQPHQVPGNAELVNQYLSTSRSKILKLVEGYVEKYSKSGAS